MQTELLRVESCKDKERAMWYKAYEGMTSDPKFQEIAIRTGLPVPYAVCVWVALMEYACPRNGSIAGFLCEAQDKLLGMEAGTCQKIYDAMKKLRMIERGRIRRWEARQARDFKAVVEVNPSTLRSRKHRAKKKAEELMRMQAQGQAQAQPAQAIQEQAGQGSAIAKAASIPLGVYANAVGGLPVKAQGAAPVEAKGEAKAQGAMQGAAPVEARGQGVAQAQGLAAGMYAAMQQDATETNPCNAGSAKPTTLNSSLNSGAGTWMQHLRNGMQRPSLREDKNRKELNTQTHARARGFFDYCFRQGASG